MSSKLGVHLALMLLCNAPAVGAPVSLYGRWGVFRDGRSCHAVTLTDEGAWLAVVADRLVVAAPGRTTGPTPAATLSIGGKRFAFAGLRADGADGAAIIAALRHGATATLATTDRAGRRHRDRLPLAQAALALDAAVVACAR